MPKVGIYCRLSIEDKDGDESQRIRIQKNMLWDYCSERNWEIIDIYVVNGFSGIGRARPVFSRLTYDCEQGKIDIVLYKNQSRMTEPDDKYHLLINPIHPIASRYTWLIRASGNCKKYVRKYLCAEITSALFCYDAARG